MEFNIKYSFKLLRKSNSIVYATNNTIYLHTKLTIDYRSKHIELILEKFYRIK
jgi:hypothetical protein